jgi:hypothetical protein
VIELLQALESSGLSTWWKESSTAYVSTLAFHTIGLTFLVGISGAMAARVLGVARAMPLEPMQDFFPLMYTGLLINLCTGLILFCLYPISYVTDATFYIKLGAIAVAAVMIRKLRTLLYESGNNPDRVAETRQAKVLSATMLFVWLIAVVAGRVTAYTVPTKLATAGAVFVVLIMALLIGFAVRQLGWFKSSPQST